MKARAGEQLNRSRETRENDSVRECLWSLPRSLSVALFLIVFSGIDLNAAMFVFEDDQMLEGDQEVVATDLSIVLSEESSQPVVVEFEIEAGSASVSEDFELGKGRLVFVPGSLAPGLPLPKDSKDPFIRSIRLEKDYGIDVLAELDRPVGLAFASQGSLFGEDLFAGYLYQNGMGVSDYIVRVDYRGEVEDFAELLPEADPTSLEFPPLGSRYGDFLFLSANNRDGNRPGDQGGTVQRVDVNGNVIDFSPVGIPLGPGEPGELVFGGGTDFGDTLFLANSVGSPGDILAVQPNGTLAVVVDDGLFEDQDLGLAPRSLAIDTEGDYGHLIYFGEFGRRCSCLKKLHPDGRVEAWLSGLPGDPYSIAFAPPGVFEGDMFVAVDNGESGSILRVQPDGEYVVFLEGLQGFLSGNGKGVMEFSREGSVMYIADYFADRIYRVAPSTTLSVAIVGDRVPEPDETVLIRFQNPVNGILPREELVLTIENDDEGDSSPTLTVGSEILLREDSGPRVWFFGVKDDVTPLDKIKVQVEVVDDGLVVVRNLEMNSSSDGFQVSLDPVGNQFGKTTLQVSLTDESGNRVEETVLVFVEAVNDPPTLDPIDDVRVPFDQSDLEVLLGGISSGAENEMDDLIVDVSVSGEGFRPEATVRYQSSERSGSVFFSMQGRGFEPGEVFVDVRVDDSAIFQNEVSRRFRIVFDGVPDDIDLPPTVEIISPMPRRIFAPQNAGVPLSATVPIEVAALDDRGIDRVELFANEEPIGVIAMAPFNFNWEEVPVGDYLLSAIAYDSAGQAGSSGERSIAVAEMNGSVAIVRNHELDEIDKMVQYLFEMGLDSDLFWAHELAISSLSAYDLVIWHSVSSESVGLLSGTVEGLADHFGARIPIYFIGDGSVSVGAELSDREQGLWESLTGLASRSEATTLSAGLHRVTKAEADELVRGRYGAIAGEDLMLTSVSESPFGENGFVIVQTDEKPSMIVSPDPTRFDTEETRMANQTFLLCDRASPTVVNSLKNLFQNTVCWLLHCATCNAVDLELLRSPETGDVASDDEFLYRATVKHSGECEGSAVVVTVPIPDGVDLVDYSTDRGRGAVEAGALKFYLGRMPSASEAQLEWRFDPSEVGSFSVMARLTSNNREVSQGNNELSWISPNGAESVPPFQIRRTENGTVELRIIGDPLKSYNIYHSSNLKAWKVLRRQEAGIWGTVRHSPGIKEAFYRLEPLDP